MESTLWYSIPQCEQYNLNFPHCRNYIVNVSLPGKNGLKFSTKMELKSFMLNNVESKFNKTFHTQCGKRNPQCPNLICVGGQPKTRFLVKGNGALLQL